MRTINTILLLSVLLAACPAFALDDYGGDPYRYQPPYSDSYSQPPGRPYQRPSWDEPSQQGQNYGSQSPQQRRSEQAEQPWAYGPTGPTQDFNVWDRQESLSSVRAQPTMFIVIDRQPLSSD